MAKLRKQETGFTQIKNEVLSDRSISFKAKGIYAYMFSKPDGWEFAAERIQVDGADGRKAVLAGLKELEQAGYLERKKLQSGKVEYYLSFAKSPNSTQPKPHSAETGLISNKDSESNTDKKATPSDASASRDIGDIIDLFKAVNPSHARLFANKTQRAAVERLLKIYPRPQLDKIVEVLEQTNTHRYAPTITTPLQLETSIGKLKAYIQGQRWADKQKGKDILGL